ncbi:hypothetical protein EON81_05465 [bacterium]|nr:MAG: hypothetical protein EON81_05465 [bacterium]
MITVLTAQGPNPFRIWKIDHEQLSISGQGTAEYTFGVDSKGPFRLELLTGKRTSIDASSASTPAGRQKASGHGLFKLLKGNAIPARFDAVTPPTKISLEGKELSLVWDTPQKRLAVATKAGEKSCTLYELKPGETFEVAKVRLPLPDVTTIIGDPESGCFAASWDGSNNVRSELKSVVLLPGLTLAPRNPAIIYSLDSRGLLGSEDIGREAASGTPYVEAAALSLSDPITGRKKWSTKQFNRGEWWGDYIVASSGSLGSRWSIIDPKTGKTLRSNVFKLEGGANQILVCGDVLILRRNVTGRESSLEGWSLNKSR